MSEPLTKKQRKSARKDKMLLMLDTSETHRMEHIAELQDENKALRADKERLDWFDAILQKPEDQWPTLPPLETGGQIRAAIDRARSSLSDLQEKP